jgi:hypothetical protein
MLTLSITFGAERRTEDHSMSSLRNDFLDRALVVPTMATGGAAFFTSAEAGQNGIAGRAGGVEVNDTSKSPVADADGIVSIEEPRTALATIRRKKTKPAPERLPWFDPWRGARGPALRSLVVTIRDALDKHEKTSGDRRRARRPDDQRRYESAVETVVANLAQRHRQR